MPPKWKQDLSESATAFLDYVWPVVGEWLGDGDLLPCELAEDDLKWAFDVESGVDAWHVARGLGMRGIASRVQGSKLACRSITIRSRRTRTGTKTELAKRLWALEHKGGGWLLPTWTIQGYVKPSLAAPEYLAAAYLVDTHDLYEYVRDGGEGSHWYREKVRSRDGLGNEFLVVPCTALEENGVIVMSYERDGEFIWDPADRLAA